MRQNQLIKLLKECSSRDELNELREESIRSSGNDVEDKRFYHLVQEELCKASQRIAAAEDKALSSQPSDDGRGKP